MRLQNQGSVKGRAEGVRSATRRFGVPTGLCWRREPSWAGSHTCPVAAVPGGRAVVRGSSSRDVRPLITGPLANLEMKPPALPKTAVWLRRLLPAARPHLELPLTNLNFRGSNWPNRNETDGQLPEQPLTAVISALPGGLAMTSPRMIVTGCGS